MNVYILLTLGCAFMFAVGAILCKYGMKGYGSGDHPNILHLTWYLLRNRVWFLGVFVSLCSNAAVLQIQSVLDLSVVHSILTSTYIFTLLLGYWFLDEKLTRNQWIGTVTVLLGTVLIVYSGHPVTGGDTNVDNLLFQSLVSALLIVILIAWAMMNKSINYEIAYAVCAGIAFGNCQVFVKASTNLITEHTGSFSILSVQSVSEFLHIWPSLALIVFSVTGFVCMHISLTHGKVSICMALLAVISRGLSTSSGFYVYDEMFSFIKLAGITVILAGVFIIAVSSVRRGGLQVSPA